MTYFTTFDYDDIQLVPNKCIIKSRKEADTHVKFGPRTFKIPVVPANMASIIDEPLAVWLAQNGYYYVMHRFQPEERLGFVRRMHERGLYASISVGIKDSEYAFIDQLKAAHQIPEYTTIDVAHGHSDYVIKMIHYIRQQLPSTFLTAGNIATAQAVRDLENAGADATKVGVGPGKACTTRLKTGFGTAGWQLSAIRACSKAAQKPIIADGGIRHNGDITKSIRFGATMIMVGWLFAGHDETPGRLIVQNGKKYKEYWGSASAKQKGTHQNVEGRQMLVPYRGHIADTLADMQQSLQSSISYAGGRTLEAIRHVDYQIIHSADFSR